MPASRTAVAVGDEGRPDERVDVVGEPDDADLGRRGDRAAGRLVVERDVAAGDRDPEGPAGVAEAADGLPQLPERLRPGGVAEVEAVRDAQRARPGDAHVAGRLGDRQRGAEVRVERGDGLVAVGRGDEGPPRPLDAEHGGAAPGAGDRVRLDVVVVLLVDPAARREVRAAEEAQQDGAGVHPPLREELGRRRREARARGPRGGGPAARRAARRRSPPRPGRGPGTRASSRAPGFGRPAGVEAALDDGDVAVGGHPPDHRAREAPAGADLGDRREAVRPDDRDHPLLATR